MRAIILVLLLTSCSAQQVSQVCDLVIIGATILKECQ